MKYSVVYSNKLGDTSEEIFEDYVKANEKFKHYQTIEEVNFITLWNAETSTLLRSWRPSD